MNPTNLAHASGIQTRVHPAIRTRHGSTRHAVRVVESHVCAVPGLLRDPYSDVRMDLVQDLRRRIASGTYFVLSTDVADRMIDSLLT